VHFLNVGRICFFGGYERDNCSPRVGRISDCTLALWMNGTNVLYKHTFENGSMAVHEIAMLHLMQQ